jgi:hypothetical protein
MPGCELNTKGWRLRCTIARRRAPERGAVAGAGDCQTLSDPRIAVG